MAPKKQKKQIEDFDYLQYENLTLRVTLSQTLKQLLPICLFVITQHAYLYMEILGIKFFTFSAAITIIMSGLVSSFFLVYSYAVVINGLGKQFYIRDENHLNSMKSGFRRLYYVEKVA